MEKEKEEEEEEDSKGVGLVDGTSKKAWSCDESREDMDAGLV